MACLRTLLLATMLRAGGVMAESACGHVGYSDGELLGWSAQRQQQGLFASPLALGPCGAASGGWRCAADEDEDLTKVSSGSRQVATVDADDLAMLHAFESTYRNREPLLIRSTKRSHAWLGKGKKARAKRQKFGRDALLKAAGAQVARAGLSHDIINNGGEGYVTFTVADYIAEFMSPDTRQDTMKGEPFYIFQRARKATATADGEAMDWAGSLAAMLAPPDGTQLFEKIDLRKDQVP